MKARPVIGIYSFVLIASGFLTWLAFQPGEQKSSGGLLVVDAKSEQIDRIEYKTEKRLMQAVAMKDGSGFRLSIRQKMARAKVNKKPADSADKPGDDMLMDGGKPTEKLSRYRASKDFGDALKRVMPLEAVRDLGKVAPDKLKEFGLNPPIASLLFVSKGQTVKFKVGKRTYGRSSFYLQHDPDGPVSLVSSGLLTVLDFRPPRYKELRLLGLQSNNVLKVTVDCDGMGSRTFLQKNRFQAKGAKWVADNDQDSVDSLYSNWMKKLLRQSLVEYLSEPVKAAPGASCRLAFFLEGAKEYHAELTWHADSSGKQTFFGHSDFSGDWVRLEPSTASALVADIPAVLGIAEQEDRN